MLHGLPTPRTMHGVVTLTDPHQRRRGSGCEVTCAPLPAGSTDLLSGVPVTTLARTVADVALSWPLEAALVAAGAARWQDRSTGTDLRAAVDAGVAMECDGRVRYRDPWHGRSTEEVHWREKRRAEVLAAAGVRFWRVAETDLGRGRPAALARPASMLAHPLPGPRRFAESSERRLRRTG